MSQRPFILITIIVHNVERKLEKVGERKREEDRRKRAGCNLASSEG